jgi:hypothetical protein
MNERRKQFLIEKKLQWQLARRHILSWLLGGLIVLSMPFAVSILYGIYFGTLTFGEACQELLDAIWYPLLIVLLLIPLGIQESIRFTNRIAGPVYRMRLELRKMLNGDAAAQIRLRRHDFMKEFVDEFNLLSAKVNEWRDELGARDSASTGECGFASCCDQETAATT